ncbi:MAG: hypothetical protein JWN72_750 [Thermoleophilia bacterium]|nr:hypothetical protein [Thermoleophilia bacterium]
MANVTTIEATGNRNLQLLARELADASLDHERSTWMSMYVDLDPMEFATVPDRAACIASALDEAARTAPDSSWGELLADLRRAFALGHHDIDGARGLLVYSSDPAEATIVKLPCVVDQHVAFDSSVHVRPLVEALPGDRWCVLLVNRRSTRILLGDSGAFEELTRFTDDVEGQHSMGGWSQARFERNIEEQAQRHIRETLALVEQLHQGGQWQHLLVAAPDELHAYIQGSMPDQSKRDFVRWISCDVENAETSEIVARAKECITAYERDGMLRALSILEQNAGQNRRAALGIDATLRALNEQRVDTVLIAEGFRRPGAICDHGDWLAPGSSACPVHGRRMRPAADVVEAAIESAVRAGSKIVTVLRHEEGDMGLDSREFQRLTDMGQIAAITRFELDDTAVPDAWE